MTTAIVVGMTVVALLVVSYLLLTPPRESPASGDPNRFTTTEAKEMAIDACESVEELEICWAAWEQRGWSRDGMIYAHLLERKKEIQGWLSQADQDQLLEIDRRWREGKNLPKITGRRGPGVV